MPREKPRGIQLRREALPVTPLQRAYLWDDWRPGEPVPEDADPVERFFWGQGDIPTIDEGWNACRETILRQWVRERPGTRPEAWWTYEAPEPRQRLGGTGTEAWKALAYAETYTFGIPTDWVQRWAVDLYNGRTICRDGEPFKRRSSGVACKEGDFPYSAVDPYDPPTFESEAVYLRRHGLLLEGEEARVPAEAWEPEAVEP